MPLYEYECDNGHRFEKILKFSDPPLAACPTCGAAVRKLFSSPAIQFKGSGFYITDYAKKDSAAAGKPGENEKGDKAEAAKESKAADAKGETKTETKSETKSETRTETKTENKPESKTAAPKA